MRKRLGSLLLALTLTTSVMPMAALAAEEDIQILAVEDTEQLSEETVAVEDPAADTAVPAAEDEDPETYKKQHRGQHDEAPNRVQSSTSKTMLFANRSIASIYNKKLYTVPSGKKITQGLDVSYHDDVINWAKVKQAGTDWAIIRVGYSGYGSGAQYKDVQFDNNMRGAAAQGLPVGVYIYSQATTVAMAKAEAKFCLDNIKGYSVSLPIVMDVEYAEDSSGRFTGLLYNAKLTSAQQTQIIEAFCETIKSAGYTPMIYASKSMLQDHMNAAVLEAKYPIWMAHYTTSTGYGGKYQVWQYADTGRVDGINYAVDCNFGIDFGDIMTTQDENTHATDIALDRESMEVSVSASTALQAQVQPADSTDAVKWKSSNPAVAKVSSDGTVTGVTCGKAVITATAGKKSASCAVTVTPEKAKLSSVRETADHKLRVRWKAAAGANKYYVYRSESGVAGSFHIVRTTADLSWKDTSVDKNKRYYYRVKAFKKLSGTTYKGKVSSTMSGVVGKEKIEIRLDCKEMHLVIGENGQLTAATTPAQSVLPITWSSSAPEIVSVEDGALTAVGIGSAVITAEFGGVRAACTVTVVPQALPSFALSLTSNSIRLTWDAVEHASRYYVYRSTDRNAESWGKSVCSTTKKIFNDTNVEAGKVYYYKIVAATKAADGKYYRSAASAVRGIVALFDEE